jgi:hypothetical protein
MQAPPYRTVLAGLSSPSSPLRNFVVSTCIDRVRNDYTISTPDPDVVEYLRIRIKLRVEGVEGAEEVRVIQSVASLIEKVVVTRSGFGVPIGTESRREYTGNQLYILSYLQDEPASGIVLDARGEAHAAVDLPYLIMTGADRHIQLVFKGDLEPSLHLSDIALLAVPTTVRHRVTGFAQRTSLVPRGSIVSSVRGVRVICALVWYARGCQARDVTLELRDGSEVLCGSPPGGSVGSGGWVGWDIGEQECVILCLLPWLSASDGLKLHVQSVGLELLSSVEIVCAVLHAPEGEGWVMIERGSAGEESENGRKAAWRRYVTSWVATPRWYRRKVQLPIMRGLPQAVEMPRPLPTEAERDDRVVVGDEEALRRGVRGLVLDLADEDVPLAQEIGEPGRILGPAL